MPNYCTPICESCGRRTDEVVETRGGEVLCEQCYENRRQADADRAYDEWRDRQIEDGRWQR